MTLSPPFLLFLAYLLGSLPFGLILTRLYGLGDIRKIGSGNIGATNVLRTGKKSLAFLTLILDALKGAAAVWLAMYILPEQAPMAGLAALLGHMFPFWLAFKGGKGVATLIGVLLALSWPLGLMMMLVWLAAALMLRISSLAALCAVLSIPIFINIFHVYNILPAVTLMIFFVIIKHRNNILRLFTGTEPKIGQNS
ncbi:MAG TPA: acyl-phosphate glycerol 3-phosphate acyltransferase [Rhodospirillaceae bacterium]|nr:acyl-phosphate glycerol 3-phosphate acyltransferase [Rhodospirillaceae bacterium]